MAELSDNIKIPSVGLLFSSILLISLGCSVTPPTVEKPKQVRLSAVERVKLKHKQDSIFVATFRSEGLHPKEITDEERDRRLRRDFSDAKNLHYHLSQSEEIDDSLIAVIK